MKIHKSYFDISNELKASEGGLHQCVPHKDTVKVWMELNFDANYTDDEIVSSWKIEYAIFNLVYIYRTFDWENDYLIYSGW